MRTIVVTGFVLSCLAPPTLAGVVLDQHQPSWSSEPSLVVGGSSDRMLAQTFVAGRSGELDHVELVFTCDPSSDGLFTVELRGVDAAGLPADAVLASVGLDASRLRMDPIALREVALGGVELSAGTAYAIVMRGDPWVSCLASKGGGLPGYPRGVPYVGGDPPGWRSLVPPMDLPFYVYVDVDDPTDPRYCDVADASGVPGPWLLASLPICGCLRDEVYRAHRCWFAFPEFTLWRELALGAERRARWSVLPLNAQFRGLRADELGVDGNLVVAPIDFAPGLAPGKVAVASATYQGSAERSRVRISFPGAATSIEVTFTTRLATPDQGQ